MSLTLEEIFDSKRFEEKTLKQPQWLKNGLLSFVDDWPGTEKATVWTYDPATDRKEPLFDPETLRLPGQEKPLEVKGVVWAPSGDRLVLTGEAVARFKPCGDLFLYELELPSIRQLTRADVPQYHPKFSPDGMTLGLVRGNNVWVIDVETGAERQLTFDGTETLYNGRCGWVYEEELGLADGWAWSPDGKTIAYLQQDESAVPIVLLPRYEQPHGDPEVTRYPKAGDPNPKTRLGLLHVETGATRWVELPGASGEHYLAAFQWTSSGTGLLVQVVPRLQNRLDLAFVDVATAEATAFLREEDARWVDHASKLHFSPNRDYFLWPSDEDGRRHLYLRSANGSWKKQVTSGPWDVAEIAGASAGPIFFTAARPDPTERHLYKVVRESDQPTCLTDSTPGWHRATLSEDGKWLLHMHSSLSKPPSVAVRKTDCTLVQALVHQKDDFLEGADLQSWEILTIETQRGDTLYARMLKPRHLEPGRRCPAIMYTYGGPGSQVVTNQWGGKRGLWEQFMAQQGFVMLAVDNRGTGGRGREPKKQVYLRLGELETEDQIAGARYLQGLPFVDPERIGIWGWSYGGYMATLCMLRGADVFKAGIAVAPVTDWTLYDTIYTERYMQSPAENPEGYRNSSPVHEAEKLKGKFLLIHGLMDDNVHFQNAARLAEALQNAKKPFETMFYPSKRHGIDDRHYHLYTAMTEFWRRSL